MSEMNHLSFFFTLDFFRKIKAAIEPNPIKMTYGSALDNVQDKPREEKKISSVFIETKKRLLPLYKIY
jgi:hypothetical protein